MAEASVVVELEAARDHQSGRTAIALALPCGVHARVCEVACDFQKPSLTKQPPGNQLFEFSGNAAYE